MFHVATSKVASAPCGGRDCADAAAALRRTAAKRENERISGLGGGAARK